jgi:uncharacterized protein (TIGR02594 family)
MDNAAPWLEIARKEMGVHEKPGPEAERRIVEYHATTSLKATSDEVSWCSSFVNWAITQAGLVGTNSAAARSWLRWGVHCEVKPGAIAVFPRGANPKSGHVGFVVAQHPGGYVDILGGNQSNCVRVMTFKLASALDFRWPGGVA